MRKQFFMLYSLIAVFSMPCYLAAKTVDPSNIFRVQSRPAINVSLTGTVTIGNHLDKSVFVMESSRGLEGSFPGMSHASFEVDPGKTRSTHYKMIYREALTSSRLSFTASEFRDDGENVNFHCDYLVIPGKTDSSLTIRVFNQNTKNFGCLVNNKQSVIIQSNGKNIPQINFSMNLTRV